jgi:hypothetical protein
VVVEADPDLIGSSVPHPKTRKDIKMIPRHRALIIAIPPYGTGQLSNSETNLQSLQSNQLLCQQTIENVSRKTFVFE